MSAIVELLPGIVAAVIAGLLLCAATLASGAWLVRRLRLPNDPPDDCRYEAEAPAAAPPGGDARARARLRHLIGAAGASTLTARHAAAHAIEALRELGQPERCQAEAAAIAAAADRAEQRWQALRSSPADDALATSTAADCALAAEQCHTGLAAILAQLPDNGPAEAAARRRLLLLAAALIVAVGLCLLTFWLRP